MTYAGNPDIIDLTVLAQMVGDDPEKIRKFSRRFIETARLGLTELAEALGERKIESVVSLGHRLKSSARAVGALRFGALCQSLEELKNGGRIETAHDIVAQLVSLLDLIEHDIKKHTN